MYPSRTTSRTPQPTTQSRDRIPRKAASFPSPANEAAVAAAATATAASAGEAAAAAVASANARHVSELYHPNLHQRSPVDFDRLRSVFKALPPLPENGSNSGGDGGSGRGVAVGAKKLTSSHGHHHHRSKGTAARSTKRGTSAAASPAASSAPSSPRMRWRRQQQYHHHQQLGRIRIPSHIVSHSSRASPLIQSERRKPSRTSTRTSNSNRKKQQQNRESYQTQQNHHHSHHHSHDGNYLNSSTSTLSTIVSSPANAIRKPARAHHNHQPISSSPESQTTAISPSSAVATTNFTPVTAHNRNSSFQTRYMNMLLAVDKIPRLHNILASFFSWTLLAGFIILPATFSSPAHPTTTTTTSATTALITIAALLAGVGSGGMSWLAWRWRRNYIWLLNRVYMPGTLNGLAGLVATVTAVYAQHGGSWGSAALGALAAQMGVFVGCGGLFVVYNKLLLGKVRREHWVDVDAGGGGVGDDSGRGGGGGGGKGVVGGVFIRLARMGRTPPFAPGSVV